MATGGMEELAAELQCPVCFEEMDKPKVLNCKHVFCSQCLHKLLRGNKIQCPLCKQEQRIERLSGVDGLPEPLLIRQLQEKITKFISAGKDHAKMGRKCDLCQKTATQFCMACMENLCDSCQSDHSKSQVTKYHKVTLISKWTICPKHAGKPIVGYCHDCKKGLCRQCEKDGHSQHSVSIVHEGKLLNERKKLLSGAKANTSTGALNMQQYMTNLHEIETGLKQGERIAHNKIDSLIKIMEELKSEVTQHVSAEQKKLDIHKGEVEDIAATRNSLHTFIDEILHRDSAPEIVMAVDELPDISTNSTPVPPTCKIPVIGDTTNIQQTLASICTYINPFLPTSSAIIPPRSAAVPLDTTLSDHSPVSAHLGDLRLPAPPSPGLTYTKTWEVKPGGNTSDVLWDEEESVWWLRTDTNLYKYTKDGTKLLTSGNDLITDHGRLCMDSKRGLLVTSTGNKLLCFNKSGELLKDVTISENDDLRGITYCSHRDVYILSHAQRQCLWFIDSNDGNVVQQLGSQGSADTQFHDSYFLCSKVVSKDMCHIIVSDQGNHCIKIFTHDGDFIRRLGSLGSGDLQLEYPYGVSVDMSGRIIVCDCGNKRVVSFQVQGEEDKFNVLLSAADLGNNTPDIPGATGDGRTIFIGFGNTQICAAYRLQRDESSAMPY